MTEEYAESVVGAARLGMAVRAARERGGPEVPNRFSKGSDEFAAYAAAMENRVGDLVEILADYVPDEAAA